MSKIEVKKVCQFCGKEFIAHKLSTRFCSHKCSQRSYKVRLREQKLEKVVHQENLPDISPTTLKKEYLSCEDVAKLMGISSTTVYRYCVTGKMNCIRMNRKILINMLQVQQTILNIAQCLVKWFNSLNQCELPNIANNAFGH